MKLSEIFAVCGHEKKNALIALFWQGWLKGYKIFIGDIIFMNTVQKFVACIGRILLGAVFFLSALLEVLNWQSMEERVLKSISRWTASDQGNVTMSEGLMELTSWLPWILLVAICCKFLGAFMVMVGWRVRLGAFFLLFFLIPATIISHDFWQRPEAVGELEFVMFLKNVAIMGGLLVLIAMGKGSCQEKN